MNVINTQLDEQLEKAEFSLITSEYEQLTQILAAIDPKVIDESELIARYYYLKGFEMILRMHQLRMCCSILISC